MPVIRVRAASIVLSLLACGLTSHGNSQAIGEPANTRAAPQISTPPKAGDRGAPAPKDATKVDVGTDGLYAELYLPARRQPVPVLIALGGGEGGLQSASEMAVTFVPQGYAVLALAYFEDPGLPSTLEGVRLEYFSHAIRWLEQRPQIDPHRTGIIGWSRGAEAARLVASRESDIRAVIAVSPTA
jgi:dienelactone hydrolase